jgi:phage-related protein
MFAFIVLTGRATFSTAIWEGVLTVTTGTLTLLKFALIGATESMVGLTVAMLANPVGAVVIGFLALFIVLGILYWRVKSFRDWVNRNWKGILVALAFPFILFPVLAITTIVNFRNKFIGVFQDIVNWIQ